MRVFIGMETSGALRRRFMHLGHDVFSCDMLPAEDGGDVDHIIGDVFEALDDLWAIGWWPELAIFHPTCTYLTNSAAWAFADPDFERYPGVGYHQRVQPGTLTGAERRRARGRTGRCAKDHGVADKAQADREPKGRDRVDDREAHTSRSAVRVRRRCVQGDMLVDAGQGRAARRFHASAD